MKIILSKKYKKLKISQFEGHILNREEEDEWADRLMEQNERMSRLPSLSPKGKKIRERRGRGSRHNTYKRRRSENIDPKKRREQKSDEFFEEFGKDQ